MNPRDPWQRLLASLHAAALDDALWPKASRLIDEAIGIKGNALLTPAGPERDAGFRSCVSLYRGEPREDLGREYFQYYRHWDFRLPRLRRLPAGRLVHVTKLYTKRELKTNPAYNDYCPRSDGRNSLSVRLIGAGGSDFAWVLLDPVKADWQAEKTRLIKRLMPHVRHFVDVRQAVAGAHALGGSFVTLLDSARLGVIHLDRQGRIARLNDNARDLFGEDNALRVEEGFLRAWQSGDDAQLKGLLAAALPTSSRPAAGGSLRVTDPHKVPGLTLHVHPVPVPEMDFGAPDLGALVLIEGLERPRRLDAGLVGPALGLSAVESQVAVLLAEGRTVPEIAVVCKRAQTTIRTHVRRIHAKLGLSRRADLVRLVLSVPERARIRHRHRRS